MAQKIKIYPKIMTMRFYITLFKPKYLKIKAIQLNHLNGLNSSKFFNYVIQTQDDKKNG